MHLEYFSMSILNEKYQLLIDLEIKFLIEYIDKVFTIECSIIKDDL